MSLDQSISEQENIFDRKNQAYTYILLKGFILQSQLAMKSESLGKNLRNFICIMANYSTREQTEAVVAKVKKWSRISYRRGGPFMAAIIGLGDHLRQPKMVRNQFRVGPY